MKEGTLRVHRIHHIQSRRYVLRCIPLQSITRSLYELWMLFRELVLADSNSIVICIILFPFRSQPPIKSTETSADPPTSVKSGETSVHPPTLVNSGKTSTNISTSVKSGEMSTGPLGDAISVKHDETSVDPPTSVKCDGTSDESHSADEVYYQFASEVKLKENMHGHHKALDAVHKKSRNLNVIQSPEGKFANFE